MAATEGNNASIPKSLLSRIQAEAGKSLDAIEKEWSEQLAARHEALKKLEGEHVTSVAHFFEKAAEENPDRMFLVYGAAIDEGDEEAGESCHLCRTRNLTYQHVDHASNAVAAWALKLQKEQQSKKPSECSKCKGSTRNPACGECMCNSRVAALLMLTSPEYIIIFLGLLKAGMTVALLHPQLRGLMLRRAVEEAGAELLICDDLTLTAVREAWLRLHLKESMEGALSAQGGIGETGSYPFLTFICGVNKPNEAAGEHSLIPHVHRRIKEFFSSQEEAHHKLHLGEKKEGEEHKCKPEGFPLLLKARVHISAEAAGGTTEKKEKESSDSAAMALHSGTLGLPCCYLYTADLDGHMRATFLSHWRFISAGITWQHAVPLSSSDRLLVTVQLSHEVALHALASAVACRGTLLLRAKSSLLSLWPDITALDCSVLWHTGTMWSRLLNAHERFHKGDVTQRLGSWGTHPSLRASVGTGLGEELWPVIQKVFTIPAILEFHSLPNLQTGHILLNSWGVRGACGFVPNSAYEKKGLEKLVAFNEEKEEIERDSSTHKGKEAPKDPVTQRQRGPFWSLRMLLMMTSGGERQRETENRNDLFLYHNHPLPRSPCCDLSGELVMRVREDKSHCFTLFTNEKKIEKFLYHDLFVDGDTWCRSGDLMERDAAGFFYLHGRIGPTFRVDGEAAPGVEIAEFLTRHAGVLGARVEGMRVFSHPRKGEGSKKEETVKREVEEAQDEWPGSTLKLFEAGEGQRRLKCLVACIHSKLASLETCTEGGESGDIASCEALDLDSSLLVIKEEGKGGREGTREAAEEEAEETMLSVQAFLRRIRRSLDCTVPLAMRPVVLLLCFACCSDAASSDRRSSVGSTCGSCCSREGDEPDCKCNCPCCCGCGCCRSSRQSVQALCELVNKKGCGAPKCGSSESSSVGSGCKEGGCKRCCFLFYADVNGDAFVPLNTKTFGDFVQDNYPEFGL